MKSQAIICILHMLFLGTMQLTNTNPLLSNLGLESAFRPEIQAVENEKFQEEDGDIFNPEGRTAMCNPRCLNGRCTGPNWCACEIGWQGNRCHIPICGDPCLNGGRCVGPYYCECAQGWTGSQCQEWKGHYTQHG